jgi:hypothetical protein
MDNRIIFSDNGTLIDFSTALAEYKSQTKTFSLVAAEDAIYIGSKFPFNHLYFKLSAFNTSPSDVSIAVWDNKDWKDVVEVIDETVVSGASFGQSGHIAWVPNKQKGWGQDDTVKSNGDENITGLGDITIYEKYWLKMTFSADLDEDVILNWVGNLFSDDDDLETEYSNLVRAAVLEGFQSGKTDWEEQHVKAAEFIIKHLINNKVILTKDQILERRDYVDAAVSRVAAMIFNSYGDDGENDKADAMKDFYSRINAAVFSIDRNTNAREDRQEIEQKEGLIKRR